MPQEKSHNIVFKNAADAERVYNDFLAYWTAYLDRNSTTTLEQKLDTLLSHIEIIPGGKEYDIVKQDFEKSN